MDQKNHGFSSADLQPSFSSPVKSCEHQMFGFPPSHHALQESCKNPHKPHNRTTFSLFTSNNLHTVGAQEKSKIYKKAKYEAP